MKKLILLLIVIVFVSGCSLKNTNVDSTQNKKEEEDNMLSEKLYIKVNDYILSVTLYDN